MNVCRGCGVVVSRPRSVRFYINVGTCKGRCCHQGCSGSKCDCGFDHLFLPLLFTCGMVTRRLKAPRHGAVYELSHSNKYKCGVTIVIYLNRVLRLCQDCCGVGSETRPKYGLYSVILSAVISEPTCSQKFLIPS